MWTPLTIAAVTVVSLVCVALVIWVTSIRKVMQGKVLLVHGVGGKVRVAFDKAVVLPLLHRAEALDISVHTLEIDRRGSEGLVCQDHIRADLKATFYIRVNPSRREVLRVIQRIGIERASDIYALQELFLARFTDALRTAAGGFEFLQLYRDRAVFRERVLECVGEDLHGFMLEDVAIDYLEQTPIEALDPNNVSDAKGIKRIMELTS